MEHEATILLVDDNRTSRTMLRRLLEGEQRYKLLEAGDGAEALQQVEATPSLDLVLLDVNLPDLSGIEVCRTLKKSSQTDQIRVVLISAVSTDDDSIAKGLSAGADGYLTQPIEPTALRAWVRAALRIRQLEKVLRGKSEAEVQDEIEVLRHFSRLSHAVNNPLQSLIATIDLLGMDLDGNLAAMESLDSMLALSDRVARIVGEASQMAKHHLAKVE